MTDQYLTPLDTRATLTDGRSTYTFMFPPESLDWLYQGDYSILSVLDTPNPTVNFKSSSTILSLPKVLLVTPGANQDVSKYLTPLNTWVSRGTKLKFSFGSFSIPICYIRAWRYKVTQVRLGYPSHVTGSLEIIKANSEVISQPKPTTTKSAPGTQNTQSTTGTTSSTGNQSQVPRTEGDVLTVREQDRVAEKIQAAIRNPAVAQALGLPNNNNTTVIQVKVSDDYRVTFFTSKGSLISSMSVEAFKRLAVLKRLKITI
jgi:hypothetical protein